MLVSAYDAFVKRTDLNAPKDLVTREDIAIYGLVGEMGSLVSAVKRRLIAESDTEPWNMSTDEIVEELGDSMWYCFSLAQIANRQPVNIFRMDIANLRRDLTGIDEKSRRIQAALEKSRVSEFLVRAKDFRHNRKMKLSDYQNLAILTARTDGKVFLGVCLSVLTQLGAELLRRRFPEVEVAINTVIPSRKINTILGEISWHLSAVASIYELNLDDVGAENAKKIDQRLDDSTNTPLHDRDFEAHEQFPRRFEVCFVTVDEGRSRKMHRSTEFSESNELRRKRAPSVSKWISGGEAA